MQSVGVQQRGHPLPNKKIASRSFSRKPNHPRFLVTYRREHWRVSTSSRFKRFPTADEARAFIGRVSRRRGSKAGRIHASCEERGPDGRWRTLPLEEEGAT